MLDAISDGELVSRFARMFESQWEFWCTPCDEARLLVAAMYNFVVTVARDSACKERLGLDISDEVLAEFKAALKWLAAERWGMDLSKHISPHASTGGDLPLISVPEI